MNLVPGFVESCQPSPVHRGLTDHPSDGRMLQELDADENNPKEQQHRGRAAEHLYEVHVLIGCGQRQGGRHAWNLSCKYPEAQGGSRKIITLLSGVFLGGFIQVLCWECEDHLYLPQGFIMHLEACNEVARSPLCRGMKTRDDALETPNKLQDDLLANPDAWENPTLERYLEAMTAWLGDVKREPSWELICDMLEAAKIYE